jgi:hypothetical protein
MEADRLRKVLCIETVDVDALSITLGYYEIAPNIVTERECDDRRLPQKVTTPVLRSSLVMSPGSA